MSTVHAAMSTVTKTDSQPSEHADLGASCMRRDLQDMQKIDIFLAEYSPFKYLDNDRLISLSSGIAASDTDGITCDVADVVGNDIQVRWDMQLYGNISLKKADRIKTLTDFTQSVGTSKLKLNFESNSLFHRLVLVGERTDTIKHCFEYELTPYPTSLFKHNLMRKPNKPDLYRNFATGFMDATLPIDVTYVIDGGFLLHKVRWSSPIDMKDILPLYLGFLKKLGRNVDIVFDGYSDTPSVKDIEHQRRAANITSVAASRQIDENTKQIGLQDSFLANIQNKKGFIHTLSSCLKRFGFNVHQADGDADTDVVKVALSCATGLSPVAVMAEDTDILVLLLHHRSPGLQDIYFVSPPKRGRGKVAIAGKCISIASLQEKIGVNACDLLPIIHSFSGCDSTSSIFGHGKGSIFKHVTENEHLQKYCRAMQSEASSPKQVGDAGVATMIVLYGGKDKTLGSLRYDKYCLMSLQRRFLPESLPPSESATRLHSMRAHFQAVVWTSLGSSTIKPSDWGWTLHDDHLLPLQIDGDVAPESVLKVIRCSCTSRCMHSSCSCRKHGLQCVSVCKHCHGTDCANVTVDITDPSGTVDSSNTGIFSVADLPDIVYDDDTHLYYVYEEEV